MNYRPLIKIINTAIINEKAVFQAPTFLKKKKPLFNTKYVSSLFIFYFFPLAYVRATWEILRE